jgi:hypothetical protein
MSKFAELLAELNAENTASTELAKSIEAGAGAVEGNPEDEEDEGGEAGAAGAAGGAAAGAGEGAAGAGGEGGEKPLVKSVMIDGEEHEVLDVEAFMKSFGELGGRVGGFEESLEKAMGGLVTTIKSQGALIKSLSEQVAKLGGTGRGRRSVLQPIIKSMPGAEGGAGAGGEGEADNKMNTEQFLAKSHAAFEAGKISGHELTVIDVSLRQNEAIRPELLKKIVG